jgi:hypothetical protein
MAALRYENEFLTLLRSNFVKKGVLEVELGLNLSTSKNPKKTIQDTLMSTFTHFY